MPVIRTLHRYQRMTEFEGNFIDRIGQGASQLKHISEYMGVSPSRYLGCMVY